MRKYPVYFVLVCVITVLFSLTACGGNAENTAPTETPQENTAERTEQAPAAELTSSSAAEEEADMSKIEIIIDGKSFPAALYDNEAAKALMAMLPLTLDMSELNGNEKYYYLDNSLPANAGRPSGIKAGDIMLYGNSCIVLFYESFSTSYSYTPIGYIDDPSGLAAALGSGGVQVTFKK